MIDAIASENVNARRRQFSLRSLLLLVTVCSLALAIVPGTLPTGVRWYAAGWSCLLVGLYAVCYLMSRDPDRPGLAVDWTLLFNTPPAVVLAAILFAEPLNVLGALVLLAYLTWPLLLVAYFVSCAASCILISDFVIHPSLLRLAAMLLTAANHAFVYFWVDVL